MNTLNKAFDLLLTDPEMDQTDTNLLEEELEELLEEEIDGLLDLDDLLTESVSLAKQAGAGKGYRKSLQQAVSAKASSDEIDLIRAKIAEWEAAQEWNTKGTCILITTQVCACGSKTEMFGGLYLHQTHKTIATAQRWTSLVKGQKEPKGLPKHVIRRDVKVPACIQCAKSLHGFDFNSPLTWEFL